jgi:hypothetical protein
MATASSFPQSYFQLTTGVSVLEGFGKVIEETLRQVIANTAISRQNFAVGEMSGNGGNLPAGILLWVQAYWAEPQQSILNNCFRKFSLL